MPRLGDASRKNYKLLTNAVYGLAALEALVDDLETRLTALRAGYLDELDFDLNARLGSPAGASLAADLATVKGYVDDLETRLSSARAGYLDNLDNSMLLNAGKAFKKYPVAALDQDPPVVSTYYTILGTVLNAQLYYIATRQINDEAAGKVYNLRVTIDGATIVSTGATQPNNTWWYWYLLGGTDDFTPSTSSLNVAGYDALQAQSVKVEVQQTTAVGTNQKMDGRVQYGLLA